MREGIKTSLISILCVVATTASFAAPAVRSVGADSGTTFTSAASAAAANTANRAGSLRTGGYVRPTATSTSGAMVKATSPVTPITTTSSAKVSTSGTTSGTPATSTGGTSINRAASTPRLSIGKYVGSTKSTSTTMGNVSDLTQRVEKLEGDVIVLETNKQDVLKDSTYITVSGDELLLDIEKIKTDLELKDGREVEMGTNDEGLTWRYVGDPDWLELISWDALRRGLNLGEINETITNQVNIIKNAIEADLAKKLDKDQGAANDGKALVVGPDGMVAPTGVFATPDDVALKLDKNQGAANDGKALVVGADGNVAATGVFATPADVAKKLDAKYTDSQAFGKALIVDQTTGDIVAKGTFATPEDVAKKLDAKIDDADARGKALVVDAEGNIVPGEIPTPNVYNKEQIDMMVENITNTTGITEEQLNAAVATRVATHTDDPDAVGMALVVNSDGDVEATGDFLTETDLDNTLDRYELRTLGALAWKNNVGTSEIQTNAVTTEKIKDSAVTEEKLADGITDALGRVQAWEDWWKENKPGDGDYVMSVTADGTRNWFRVVGPDE